MHHATYQFVTADGYEAGHGHGNGDLNRVGSNCSDFKKSMFPSC